MRALQGVRADATPGKTKKPPMKVAFSRDFGRGKRIRTSGPCVPNVKTPSFQTKPNLLIIEKSAT
jgi:hypothetical protein